MRRPKKKPAAKKAAPREWQSVTFKTQRSLVEALDAIAAAEERTRTQVLEFACREYVQRRQRGRAAA
jgi:predicted transcriptional regulator